MEAERRGDCGNHSRMRSVALAALLCPAAPSAIAAGTAEVYFSPKGGAQAAIIREIDAAQKPES